MLTSTWMYRLRSTPFMPALTTNWSWIIPAIPFRRFGLNWPTGQTKSFPAAQGMMSHRVGEREQGELQGALQSLRSITFIIGPVLFSQVFSWFIDPKHSLHLPGAPYYLAAAMLFSAMLMATRIKQPDFTARSTSTPEPAELAPPETISSGPVAPLVEPEENI